MSPLPCSGRSRRAATERRSRCSSPRRLRRLRSTWPSCRRVSPVAGLIGIGTRAAAGQCASERSACRCGGRERQRKVCWRKSGPRDDERVAGRVVARHRDPLGKRPRPIAGRERAEAERGTVERNGENGSHVEIDAHGAARPGEAPVHRFCGEAEFRGAGVAAAKSVALSPVSVQPSFARSAAEVLKAPPPSPHPRSRSHCRSRRDPPRVGRPSNSPPKRRT